MRDKSIVVKNIHARHRSLLTNRTGFIILGGSNAKIDEALISCHDLCLDRVVQRVVIIVDALIEVDSRQSVSNLRDSRRQRIFHCVLISGYLEPRGYL